MLSPNFWWVPGNRWLVDASLQSLPSSSVAFSVSLSLHHLPFVCVCPCIRLVRFHEDTSRTELGTTLMASH